MHIPLEKSMIEARMPKASSVVVDISEIWREVQNYRDTKK